jgi:hypothetical protein
MQVKEKPVKKRKRDKDRPKRPLSAYNLFFRDERIKVLDQIQKDKNATSMGTGNMDDSKTTIKDYTKLGFAGLAKIIASRWRVLDDEKLKEYKVLAKTELVNYNQAVEKYLSKKEKKTTEEPS